MYQDVETNGQIDPSIKIPKPSEKSLGTNCGMKESANTAAFTLVSCVNKPSRKADHALVSPAISKSNFPKSFFKVNKVCIDRKNKNATPPHFNMKNAISNFAIIVDKPNELNEPQIKSPVLLPRTDKSAGLFPPKIDCRRTMATPWPGTIASNKVVSRNAGICASTASE